MVHRHTVKYSIPAVLQTHSHMHPHTDWKNATPVIHTSLTLSLQLTVTTKTEARE